MYDENERHLLRLLSPYVHESVFEITEVVEEHFVVLVKDASSVYSFFSFNTYYQLKCIMIFKRADVDVFSLIQNRHTPI